ncbi:hypothetical protein BDU57DRAFT_149730 [Ampelomyces quisqualis]|uniref:C2H2 type master regulator of conidiophore development brlA n=1 Tax=Ampelomyces quisqualis TaxID=50730 RepID=A0A6A5QVE6_AMPQU|nr:hypothetical protein BDU57DRAFT_149730 [Ampelomyces quisqualis]
MYQDQPTPPFNSPYQQDTSRRNSSLESPYPSPSHHDTQPKYPEGLGLYDYQPTLPTGLPPSPQPSESWNSHLSTGVSPLMNETIADPWTSGAFDHPVSQSPLPWASAQTSPRSSMSSCTREMSVFSHEGSEHTFPEIKVEYSGWAPEMRWGPTEPADLHGMSASRTPSLTVAPERLNADVFSYDHSYGSTPVQKLESGTMYDYSGRNFERALSEQSTGSLRSKHRSEYISTSVPRERARNRRHTDPANAAYLCHLCDEKKGFARRYNYNQHMLTHDMSRRREHPCTVPGCGKEFVRKTDLARHDHSVHQKARPFKCTRCPNVFARKDTLRRHEEEGCNRRIHIPGTDAKKATNPRHDGYTPAKGM